MSDRNGKKLEPDRVLGLGLGSPNGPAALAVIEGDLPDDARPPVYTVRHLHRWPAGTRYSRVAADTAAMVKDLANGWPRLFVDAGLGWAVVNLFRRALQDRAWLGPVLMTAEAGAVSENESGAHRWYGVPGTELASALLVLLDEDRLKFSDLEGTDRVFAALRAFGARAALVGGQPGWALAQEPEADLVFAVAAPLAVAEKHWRPRFAAPGQAGAETGRLGHATRHGLHAGPSMWFNGEQVPPPREAIREKFLPGPEPPDRNRSVFDT